MCVLDTAEMSEGLTRLTGPDFNPSPFSVLHLLRSILNEDLPLKGNHSPRLGLLLDQETNLQGLTAHRKGSSPALKGSSVCTKCNNP